MDQNIPFSLVIHRLGSIELSAVCIPGRKTDNYRYRYKKRSIIHFILSLHLH